MPTPVANSSKKPKGWSRTGCDRCKRLHTKCDETKPACLRCSRGGHTCSYNPPKAWLFNPQTTEDKAAAYHSDCVVLKAPRAHLRHPDAARNLAFFAQEAEASCGSILGQWDVTYCIHLYHEEPAFAHLLDAFTESMLALWHKPGPNSKAFYFSSLGKAIALMRTNNLRRGDESFLHCCGLLTVNELLRTMNAADVVPHLDALDQVLSKWRLRLPLLSSLEQAKRERLIESFSRRVLALRKSHLVAFAKAQQRQAALAAAGLQKGPADVIPDPIVSMPNAMGRLKSLVKNCVGVSLEHLSDTWWEKRHQNDRETAKMGLGAWSHAFEDFINKNAMDKGSLRLAKFLRVHHAVGLASVEMAALTSEQSCLRLDHLFARIVDSMEDIISTEREQTVAGPAFLAQYRFLGVIPPLFFAATRCRNPNLRVRALSLLKDLDMSEALWNARVAYHVADTVMALETERRAMASDEQQQLQAHHTPRVRALAAKCRFVEGQKAAYLSLRYLDVSVEPARELVHETVLRSEAEYAACRQIKANHWPLDPVIKTFGYSSYKLMPYIFLQTEESVRAFLQATGP